jgi:hypothetical protein
MPLSEEEKKQRKRESNKRYREKNKEYIKEWREKNKEKIQEYKKEYRQNNKEKIQEYTKEYAENNKEKIIEQNREYYKNNKEKFKEYRQTPEAKKRVTISGWVSNRGLNESKEDLDRIYHLRETQELCNACDCILTRNGDRSSTEACMDHDHETGRFRHIICRCCNSHDNWKKYFC